MTKKEFNQQIDEVLTIEQQCLINTNIYYNPEHVNYYMAYHKGDYDFCINFLKENKHILVLEKTPKEFKQTAKMFLKNKDLIKNGIQLDFD